MNAVENKKLRDILEDVDGNPREGEMLELMKKDLRKMKVADNREEPFKKKEGTTTYYQEDTYLKYVQNTNGNRSRRDNWQLKCYVRSDSCPGFFRTASRNNYVRNISRFRRGSNMRTGPLPGGKFT